MGYLLYLESLPSHCLAHRVVSIAATMLDRVDKTFQKRRWTVPSPAMQRRPRKYPPSASPHQNPQSLWSQHRSWRTGPSGPPMQRFPRVEGQSGSRSMHPKSWMILLRPGNCYLCSALLFVADSMARPTQSNVLHTARCKLPCVVPLKCRSVDASVLVPCHC